MLGYFGSIKDKITSSVAPEDFIGPCFFPLTNDWPSRVESHDYMFINRIFINYKFTLRSVSSNYVIALKYLNDVAKRTNYPKWNQ